jgi:alkanesulfonate monooxygenase SsuD/methylene tetrahydromethanopterin reductase-like flavin-dependent oxidoreductase (luciferase family)
MEIGVGLWTMRSPASAPGAFPSLYRALREEARLAEELGYQSLWIAEHHFWYDGWCPSPLVAAASALAATTHLHVATGVNLAALRAPHELAAEVRWLQTVSGGRFEHGVGLGYRAAEYDGFGLSRRHRGRRTDASLDAILALPAPVPQIWVGGFAPPAIERAARRGLGLMLPSTLSVRQLRESIAFAQETAAAHGCEIRIGVMKYTWPTDGSPAGRAAAEASLDAFTREYAGAWFPLRGAPGFHSPDLLDAQIRRSAETALIGHPGELSERLVELSELGVDRCVLHLLGDGRRPGHRVAMTELAEQLLPGGAAVTA